MWFSIVVDRMADWFKVIYGWIAFQVDTYQHARANDMSYWELRRLRKVARQFVNLFKEAEARENSA